MTTTKYAKYISPEGRLLVSDIPRSTYAQYVTAYRQQPHVIREVFTALYFDFDLDKTIDQSIAEGNEMSVPEAAQRVLDEMDDGDWWRVIEAFEEHGIQHFADDPARWASIFDQVDEDDEAGQQQN